MTDEIKGPTVVCSAFIEKEGKFLLVFCPRFKVWRVPGGRAEFKEKLEDTLIREVKEETGLDIEKPKFIGWGQDNLFHIRDNRETSRLLMFFYVKAKGVFKPDPAEIEEYKWLTIDEFKKHPNKEGALDDLFKRNSKLKL